VVSIEGICWDAGDMNTSEHSENGLTLFQHWLLKPNVSSNRNESFDVHKDNQAVAQIGSLMRGHALARGLAAAASGSGSTRNLY
jgi:hypothetical protein